MSIHRSEDTLFDEWEKSYPTDERKSFVRDGLCCNGELCHEDWNSHPGNEEELWANAQRKIVFLMKDPNSNPGEDYRYWGYRAFTAKFYKVIFNWLQGLSEITADYTPLLENNSYLNPANQTVLKYPLAIVNIKKISGGSSVANQTLYNYAERDAAFLQRQIREILQPNIIVCGGGSDCVLDIVRTYIYPEYNFEQVNENNRWCFYSEELNLLLINSWHPSARGVSDCQKIDDMMRNVSYFISKKHPGIFT